MSVPTPAMHAVEPVRQGFSDEDTDEDEVCSDPFEEGCPDESQRRRGI